MEPRRTHKDTVVISVVSNVEDGTRISGGQFGTRDGSAPCTQHGEPVGTQESVDGVMLEPSKAMLQTATITTQDLDAAEK